MNYATVCSGVEAMSLSVAGMGWNPVFFSEIEPFPCQLLKHRFPSVPNLGDMTKIEGDKYYGSIDVLAGGTPCQSFSVAGKRGGIEDGRGKLMLHFVKLAYETGARYVAWENVPGVLSSGKGEDFAALLSSLCGNDVAVPEEGWANSGVVTNADGCYGVAWRVLDAQYTRVPGFPFAVPQRRRRVWLVGCAGDWRRAAEVLFVGEGMPWYFEAGAGEGKEVARGVADRAGTASGIEVSPTEIKATDVSATIDSRCKNGPIQNQVGTAVLESHNGFNFDCFSGECKDISPTLQRKRAGDTLTYCMAHGQANAEIMQDKSPTLSCNHEQPIITCSSKQQSQNIGVDVANALGANDYKEPQVVCYENHANDSRVTDSGNLSPTITKFCGTGGGNLPLVKVGPVTYFKRRMVRTTGGQPQDNVSSCLRADANSGDGAPCIAISDVVHGDKACNGKGWNDDGSAYTLDTMATQGVCVPSHDCAGTVISRASGGGFSNSVDAAASGMMAINKATQLVRRLTPTECERLMAFPDGWTDIKPNGKPTPDSPRYKACGNSWAVNCARWVMMRIQQSEDKHNTNKKGTQQQ